MKPVAIMLSTSIVVLFGSVLGLIGTLYEKRMSCCIPHIRCDLPYIAINGNWVID